MNKKRQIKEETNGKRVKSNKTVRQIQKED